jgi:2OG-Fe(II) oxygenase superfamily
MQTDSVQRKRKWVESTEYQTDGKKRAHLRIVTDISAANDSDLKSICAESSGSLSAVDSLFDEPTQSAKPASRTSEERWSDFSLQTVSLASRTAPPIPGLFAPKVRLPLALADELMQTSMNKYFRQGSVNQVMLFGRALTSGTDEGGLPLFLTELLSTVSQLLLPELPARTHALLFPSPDAPLRARQAILNLYHPGEGISPHVDLLNRFGDGIVGISLGSGCVMSFCREPSQEEHRGISDVQAPEVRSNDEEHWRLYLPERSIIVLSEEARYEWKHGIQGQTEDFVEGEEGHEGEWISRDVRLSITFRWLLPGAEIVGEPDQ